MIAALCVAGYLVGALFGWRVGYVRGYEGARRRYRSLGHDSWHDNGAFTGAFTALLWPVALPALLVGAHLTPTPPSVRADEQKRLLDEQARTIARLEREAGIR